MKRFLLLFCFLLFYSGGVFGETYRYAYVPKTLSPTIYNFLYDKREKCSLGEKKEYPKQNGIKGVCVSCPDGTVYMTDETGRKALCFKCPAGTLTVKKDDYPMCLSLYPVVNGKAQKPNGKSVSDEEIDRMVLRLSAEYKINREKPAKQTEETFKSKEKLVNVCPYSYPDDESARKQIDVCRRLADRNDFLCPYVEKNAEGKWTCRACTRNAPYKSNRGGCFNCPYGEEMISSDDGKPVCASEAPPRPKKTEKIKKRKKKRG